MWKKLWLDEGGAILSAELCLIMVLLVIGMVVGLTALRDAIDFQLADIAGAIAALNPSYQFSGLSYSGFGNGLGIGFGNRFGNNNNIGAGLPGSAMVPGSSFTATFDTGGNVGANTGLLQAIPPSGVKGNP